MRLSPLAGRLADVHPDVEAIRAVSYSSREGNGSFLIRRTKELIRRCSRHRDADDASYDRLRRVGRRRFLLRRYPYSVIDESGEDYLYPAEFFAVIELPPAVRRALQTAV